MKSPHKTPTPPLQKPAVMTWRELHQTLSQCSGLVLDAPALLVLENRFWNEDTGNWQQFKEVFAIRATDVATMEESYPRIDFESRK